MQQMTASRDGVEIACATYGTGERVNAAAVVLVHGWSGNRGNWAHQIDFLAERYHVIAVDLGGHGDSGPGTPRFSGYETALLRVAVRLGA